jgi:hypothetical protein
MPTKVHEELKEMARRKFEKLGYRVTSVPSEMGVIFARKGCTPKDVGRPDLCAFKGDEVIIIDVVKSGISTPQLKHYQKMNKVILVYNFVRSNKNFEIWGSNDLL